jgi:hypothetical protein
MVLSPVQPLKQFPPMNIRETGSVTVSSFSQFAKQFWGSVVIFVKRIDFKA